MLWIAATWLALEAVQDKVVFDAYKRADRRPSRPPFDELLLISGVFQMLGGRRLAFRQRALEEKIPDPVLDRRRRLARLAYFGWLALTGFGAVLIFYVVQ